MKYNLNEIIERNNTYSVKWDTTFLKEQFGRSDLLPLWVADMDFKCPQPVIDAIINRAKHGIFGYAFIEDNFHNAVINWNKRRHNWDVKKEWIVFTPGIVTAVNQCVQAFCKPGDKIIIQNPVYYPFGEAILNNGCQIEHNQLIQKDDKYIIDFDDLKEKAKNPYVKMMILCNPHNPVGRVWSREELIKLGEICIENDVIIISDEIHRDLIYKGHKHIPFASISDEFAQNSITCTAPSKTFNIAGLKTSNVIIPNEKIRNNYIHQLVRNSLESANTFGIEAIIAAYNYGEEWLENVTQYLEDNVRFIDRFIKEKMPKVKFTKPEGTYLGWLDFRSITENTELLDDILINKAKVGLDSGHWFGKGGEGFARINFACPREILEDALIRIQNVIG
ncbi:pyridoxal phosphate-dependent aminotransferase [Clostridiaceae bacterium M8S5]|nr:pyridoxal phosphate-dependent aminotransferase [Clostridiaceae bacterium M8S5]